MGGASVVVHPISGDRGCAETVFLEAVLPKLNVLSENVFSEL